MDASALESAIKALEIRSDSLDSWLTFWIILVVVGVVVEVGVVIKEYFHARSEYRRGSIRSPDKPSPWDLYWGLLGGVLVAIGVAGELGIDFKSAVVRNALRDDNGKLVGLLNLEAANLRAAIAPRELTIEQQKLIGAALHKYSGKTVWLRSYRADAEAKRLGVEIKQALTLAQITVEDRLEEMYGDGPVLFGIEVTCAENALRSQRDFARSMISVLSAEDVGHLSVLPLSQFACPSDEITEIHIGIKPPTADVGSLVTTVQKASSRRLTQEAIAHIRSALLPFPAQQLAASWNKRDTEIDEVMTDFASACCALGTAEWQMSVTLRGAKAGLTGVLVLVKPDADTKTREAARVLAAALRAERIAVDGPREASGMEDFLAPARPQDSPIPSAAIAIVVAKKP
jgi:hypothetical protein